MEECLLRKRFGVQDNQQEERGRQEKNVKQL